MLRILANVTYRNLFAAQIVSLAGTGLTTVALALLAYDLAGPNAGQVLGTALAIKMLAYVGIAPFAAALAERLPRRGLLVALNVVRAFIVLGLPFVTSVWQIYVLIFLLQSASAAYTPTFQATIPDILIDERDYTQALSLSRLAYDLENLLSPMLAAALLTVLAFSDLFVGTAIGFVVAAILVLSTQLPQTTLDSDEPFHRRALAGLRLYLATPRLRGVMGINLAVASAGAMVIVNTVILVQESFGLDDQATAFALAAFGFGSMLAALALPRLLDRFEDRIVMVSGASAMLLGLLGGIVLFDYWLLLSLWFVIGLGYAMAQTPIGRLLKRSAHPEDRPAVFAAQFTLSHAMWLISYPLAGSLSVAADTAKAFLTLSALCAVGILAAFLCWPKSEADVIDHHHDDLPADHPHWREGVQTGQASHSHQVTIDRLHKSWPRDPRHASGSHRPTRRHP